MQTPEQLSTQQLLQVIEHLEDMQAGGYYIDTGRLDDLRRELASR